MGPSGRPREPILFSLEDPSGDPSWPILVTLPVWTTRTRTTVSNHTPEPRDANSRRPVVAVAPMASKSNKFFGFEMEVPSCLITVGEKNKSHLFIKKKKKKKKKEIFSKKKKKKKKKKK